MTKLVQKKNYRNENQVESSDEHTQHSRDHSYSSNNFIEEQNKKNAFRIENSDTWGCKECKVKGDKWFMKQHRYKGILKKYKKAIFDK